MCRFLAYRGKEISLYDLLYQPENSLIHQSANPKESLDPHHGDGFGVSWYPLPDSSDPTPSLYRDILPAWNSESLKSISKNVSSQMIFAHVRAATSGHVQLSNCHPFVVGTYSFMHNGAIDNFRNKRRAMMVELNDSFFNMIEGNTDSEVVFAFFLQQLPRDRQPVPDDYVKGMNETIAFVQRHLNPGESARLNLVFTDGQVMVVTRTAIPEGTFANSLYIAKDRELVIKGRDTLIKKTKTPGTGADIVSSERFCDSRDFEEVPPNTVIVLGDT
jgi:predicted glutamine amidotransferase